MYAANDAAVRLLTVLRAARGELLGSRELKERAGPEWREAMVQLRGQGYIVDEVIGNGNAHSYRLNPSCAAGPAYLNETEDRPKVTLTPSTSRMIRVNLPLEDVKRLLTLELPPRVRDVLVGAYMRESESG